MQIIDSCPCFEPTPQHYTMHSDWGKLHPSNISNRCVQTSSTNGWVICINHSLKGASLVTLITCSVEWVQPNLQGSKEKMSLYSVRSEQARSASSGNQDCQLWFLDALGLIQHVYCARLYLWLRYSVGSYHSCHWDLLQGQGVCHVVSYHSGNILAAAAHFSVGILCHQIHE